MGQNGFLSGLLFFLSVYVLHHFMLMKLGFEIAGLIYAILIFKQRKLLMEHFGIEEDPGKTCIHSFFLGGCSIHQHAVEAQYRKKQHPVQHV